MPPGLERARAGVQAGLHEGAVFREVGGGFGVEGRVCSDAVDDKIKREGRREGLGVGECGGELLR